MKIALGKFGSLVIPASLLILLFALSRQGPAQQQAISGAGVYRSKCSICHAPDGSGNTPKGRKEKAKDLRSPEVQKQSDAELYDIIAHGKKKMKPYEATLGREKIEAVLKYLRELPKK